LFRETLETPRPLVSTADAKDSGKDTIIPIKSLLLALQQMLCHSEGVIVDLSNKSIEIAVSSLSPDVSGLGELAAQSGLTSPGYNPDR
jgi:hypothetical protein